MKVESNGNCEERPIGAVPLLLGGRSAAVVVSPMEAATMAKELSGAFLSLSAPGTPSPNGPSALPPAPTLSGNLTPRRKASVPAVGTNGGGQMQTNCLICSDRATGKHYGSISCDGCKGFFRRTIRKKHNYVCRFSKNCVVDKNQRNACRRCRFDKCLTNGMRPEAVQLERDRIAATRRNGKNGNSTAEGNDTLATTETAMGNGRGNCAEATCGCGTIGADNEMGPSSATFVADAEQILQRLMDAEQTLKAAKVATVRKEMQQQETNRDRGETSAAKDSQRTATTGDVTDSMHQQLILLVEWAKHLAEFRRLPLRSQIALLRHFSAQHLILCAAFRSLIRVAASDAVWLANDRCVPRDAPKIPDINRVVARILDHLTSPMRRLRLEEREFVALKAVAFFDPLAKGIDESSAAAVEGMRHRILAAFEHQVQRVSEHRAVPLRLGNLLLLLPPLVAIARDLVEEAQLAKLFGLANVDELMVELLLPEDAETRSYSRLRTSVTSTIVQSNVTSPTPPSTPQHHRHPSLVLNGTSPSPTLFPSTNGSASSTVADERQQTTHQSWGMINRLNGPLSVLVAPTPHYSSNSLLLNVGADGQQNWRMNAGTSIVPATNDALTAT